MPLPLSEPRERPSPPRGGGFTAALGLLATALAVLVVLLAWQNLSLKRQLAASGAAGAGAEPAFSPGDPIGPLAVYDADGERTTILDGTSGRPTLLLVFTSTCPACRATFPAWRDLATRAAAAGTDVVGLRLDATPGLDPSVELPPDLAFPVFAPDHESPGALRQIQSVPTTVLVDPAGAVAASWTGSLDGEATRAVERALGAG